MCEIENVKKRPLMVTIMAVVALLFGGLTLFSGGSTLFNPEVNAAAGNYISFVLWFNFLAGFAYIGAGVLLLKWNYCAVRLSTFIAAATLAVFLAMGIFVIQFGGEYETKTVGAMVLRSSVWVLIAVLARGYWRKFKTPTATA